MCQGHSPPVLSRRKLFGGMSAAMLASPLVIQPALAADEAVKPPNAISGDEALKRLMAGNARYAANQSKPLDFAADRAARAAAQYPIASILSCSDSRVGPEFIFDQGPGALFVVRLAGNILDDEGLASLEYAAQFLGSPLILVLGHSGCGAVASAIKVLKDNTKLPGHLPELIDEIKPAVIAAQKAQPVDLLAAAIAENVRLTVESVKAAKPLLSDMVATGKVKVAGGVYDIATGVATLA
jgi:carbonic anhydrase